MMIHTIHPYIPPFINIKTSLTNSKTMYTQIDQTLTKLTNRPYLTNLTKEINYGFFNNMFVYPALPMKIGRGYN